MKRIRQALRDEFGQSLADQEFKFTFTKQVTITVAAWSCVASNPWMIDMLKVIRLVKFPSHFATLQRGQRITNGLLCWGMTSTGHIQHQRNKT